MNKERAEQLKKAMLSFYPKWQRPIVKLLAWIFYKKIVSTGETIK